MQKLIRALLFGACGLTVTIAAYLGGRSDGLKELSEIEETNEEHDICAPCEEEIGSDTM